MKIFLCLRAVVGLEPSFKKSCSNFSWSNWMTNVSAVDLGVSPSHCNVVFLLLKKIFPSGAHLILYQFERGKTL